ncbi:hypothetical protein V6N11_060458 [Hibiscus sabdariffa]|uniref:DUF676 domain-containing protein n=1 Tax=Hibiscus sabdariffa TaxID=183260 RepID=A0ABR2QQD5_9ROSI
MEGDSRGVSEKEVDDAEEIKVTNENNTNKVMNQQQQQEEEKKKMMKKKKNKKKRRSLSLPRFGCLRTESVENGGVDMEVQFPGERNDPAHLVIMVNGIIGSAQNWRFAAKQFLKKYPEDLRSRTLLYLFQVKNVISRHPSVQKISFVGHSLGGLVARYAIARLYEQEQTRDISQTNGDCGTDHLGDSCPEGQSKGKIAGLEPMNFITFATPHLGSLWHKQVPLFGGSRALEKLAARISWLLGRTGKHLFFKDGKNGKPPLLLQMASDCEDLKFISALQSFRRRVAYANAGFDHIVGWSTSSLRRRNELPKIKHLPRGDKYPHIINVEAAKIATLDEVPSEAKINGDEKINIEEEVLKGLTKLSWERVDVYFKGSRQRLLAHSTIQVKNYWSNSDGADFIHHKLLSSPFHCINISILPLLLLLQLQHSRPCFLLRFRNIIMIKPPATRNQRCKGLKVKHVLQICGMLALCIWMLHQFRNTYDKDGKLVQNVMSEHEAMKLGRKYLDPRLRESENKETGEEVEESRAEEAEDDGRGDDREKAEGEESEEVEDLIDEEDTDKESETVDAEEIM